MTFPKESPKRIDETEEPPELYCEKCGRKMVLFESIITSYDLFSGKPNIKHRYKCSKLFHCTVTLVPMYGCWGRLVSA
jgi:hypothetical protein